MRKVFFSSVLLLLLAGVPREAHSQSAKVLDNIIQDAASSYLESDGRINRQAIKLFTIIAKIPAGNNMYNVNILVNETGCRIIFIFDLFVAKTSDGWQSRIMNEIIYERTWDKNFLIKNYHGAIELLPPADTGVKVDPPDSKIKEIFFGLMLQDLNIKSGDLGEVQIKKEAVLQAHAFVQGDTVFLHNGRKVFVRAAEIKPKRSGSGYAKNIYEVSFFVYRLPEGKWSADLIKQWMREEPVKGTEM